VDYNQDMGKNLEELRKRTQKIEIRGTKLPFSLAEARKKEHIENESKQLN